MDNDVGTMLEWLHQVRRGQSIVNDQRDAMLMGDIGYRANVERIQAWIAHSLCIECLRALVDRGTEIVGVAAIHKAYVDTQLGQRVVEEIVGAAVEARRRDDLIASLSDVEDSQRLGSLARTCRQRADATFQGRHTALEGILGRIHNTRIDIAELLQTKEVGRVLRAIKNIGRGLIDRDRPRISRAIRRLLTSMQ